MSEVTRNRPFVMVKGKWNDDEEMQFDRWCNDPARFRDTIGSWSDLREMCIRIRKLSAEIDEELDTEALDKLENRAWGNHDSESFPVTIQAPYPSLVWKARRILLEMLQALRDRHQANGSSDLRLRILSELATLTRWVPDAEPQPCISELSLVCFLDDDKQSAPLRETDVSG